MQGKVEKSDYYIWGAHSKRNPTWEGGKGSAGDRRKRLVVKSGEGGSRGREGSLLLGEKKGENKRGKKSSCGSSAVPEKGGKTKTTKKYPSTVFTNRNWRGGAFIQKSGTKGSRGKDPSTRRGPWGILLERGGENREKEIDEGGEKKSLGESPQGVSPAWACLRGTIEPWGEKKNGGGHS